MKMFHFRKAFYRYKGRSLKASTPLEDGNMWFLTNRRGVMIIQYENHFLTILVTHKDKKKTFRTV